MMIKKIHFLWLALMSIVISSCKLDLLDNPNAVTTNNTDINYLASQIQVSYATHFNQVGDPGMRLTRMLNAGAAIYDNAVTPGGMDGHGLRLRWNFERCKNADSFSRTR
jgi:hypothetical protein